MIKRVCDFCGKEFGSGFLVKIEITGSESFLVDDRAVIGAKDICRPCLKKFKKGFETWEKGSEE